MTWHGPATEVVWMNYPPPTDLHEYTHLGTTFRARASEASASAVGEEGSRAKPLLEQKALLAGLLAQVGPIASAEVMSSTLAQCGDEALIISNGSSGSHPRHAGDAAANTAPPMTASPLGVPYAAIPSASALTRP